MELAVLNTDLIEELTTNTNLFSYSTMNFKFRIMVFVLQTLFAWTSGMALNCTKRSVAWCSTGEIIDPQVLTIKTGSKEAKCLVISLRDWPCASAATNICLRARFVQKSTHQGNIL